MIKRFRGNKNMRAMATLSLILTITYFVIRPISLNTYKKYLEVQKYNQDINKLEQNLVSLSVIKGITTNYKAEIDLIDKVIPQNADEKTFIRDLSFLSGRNQINLIQTKFDHYLDNVTFEIQFEGRYENATTLLEGIENLLRLTSIELVQVSALEDAPVQGTVLMNIGGKIFKKVDVAKTSENNEMELINDF